MLLSIDDKKSVVYKLSIPENLKNGRYTLMFGAGNNEITIMKATDLVVVE